MKIATYRVGGERRVGLVDEQRQTRVRLSTSRKRMPLTACSR